MVDASVILVSIFINLLHPCRNSFVVEDQLFLICLFDWGWKTDKNLKSGFWRNLVCRIAGWYCCFWYSWPLGRGRQRGTNFRSKIPLSSDVVAQQAYLAQWQFRCLRVKPIPQCKGSRLRPPTSICMVACTTQPCQWGPQSPNLWNTLITQSYWIWQVDLLPPPLSPLCMVNPSPLWRRARLPEFWMTASPIVFPLGGGVEGCCWGYAGCLLRAFLHRVREKTPPPP